MKLPFTVYLLFHTQLSSMCTFSHAACARSTGMHVNKSIQKKLQSFTSYLTYTLLTKHVTLSLTKVPSCFWDRSFINLNIASWNHNIQLYIQLIKMQWAFTRNHGILWIINIHLLSCYLYACSKTTCCVCWLWIPPDKPCQTPIIVYICKSYLDIK